MTPFSWYSSVMIVFVLPTGSLRIAIGCVVCGASVSSATGGATSGGTWAGCVGVRCFAEKTASDIQDAIDDIDWSQFNTNN